MTRTIDTRTPAEIAYDNLKTGAASVKDIPITADEQEVINQILHRPAETLQSTRHSRGWAVRAAAKSRHTTPREQSKGVILAAPAR